MKKLLVVFSVLLLATVSFASAPKEAAETIELDTINLEVSFIEPLDLQASQDEAVVGCNHDHAVQDDNTFAVSQREDVCDDSTMLADPSLAACSCRSECRRDRDCEFRYGAGAVCVTGNNSCGCNTCAVPF